MADETGLIRASIVLAGKFNPAIFSPAWFSKYELITDGELAIAETNLVHPDITQFKIEHLSVEVQPTRFMIQTSSDPIIRILDITSVIFQQLLPHTPISALGMNYIEHFKLDHWKRRAILGRHLAPLRPWGEWGKSLNRAKRPEDLGGMLSLVMKENYAEENKRGGRRVEIGPSPELPDLLTGVYMLVNDHRDLTVDDPDGAAPAIELLNAEFEQSISQARKSVADMLAYAKAIEI